LGRFREAVADGNAGIVNRDSGFLLMGRMGRPLPKASRIGG
jgi:hypothetical protein